MRQIGVNRKIPLGSWALILQPEHDDDREDDNTHEQIKVSVMVHGDAPPVIENTRMFPRIPDDAHIFLVARIRLLASVVRCNALDLFLIQFLADLFSVVALVRDQRLRAGRHPVDEGKRRQRNRSNSRPSARRSPNFHVCRIWLGPRFRANPDHSDPALPAVRQLLIVPAGSWRSLK